jgi:energy-coupling factor transport system permease protein
LGNYIVAKGKRKKNMSIFEELAIGQYQPMDSTIHRLDPRIKLLLVLAMVLFVAVTVNLKLYFLWLFLFSGLFFFSKIPFPSILKSLKSFIFFYIFIFLLQVFLTSESLGTYFYFGYFQIGFEGIVNGFIYSLRLLLFILGATFLSLTTSPMEILDGVLKFFGPLKKLKLPVEEFSLMSLISIRFIPLLLEEGINLKKAQMARGADFEGSFVQRIKKTFPLLIPLFISSFRKADDLALALEARGFQSGEKRSSFNKLKFKKEDLLFAVIITLCSILSLIIII